MKIEDGVLHRVHNEDINADGSFIVPNNVTRIGDYVFLGCYCLTSVTIPNSVTSIGAGAFVGCSKMTSVIIGNGVTSIGEGAFNSCSGLVSVMVAEGNPVYHSSGNCIIETETKTLIVGCKTSVIPTDGSVTSIGYSAFYINRGLTSITIPDSVTSIGNYAFYGCSGLTSVTIGNGVTSIGRGAFEGCSGLTSVTIPNSVTSIGRGAFYGCSKLTSKRANYKAFNLTEKGELLCRDKTYAVGEKSVVEGELKLCENGIHYCTNLYDIFRYYCGRYDKDFVIGVCEVSDENIGGDGDSKRCARWVKPTKILTIEEVIRIMNGEER